jgi:glycerol-3-phosphate acyltransferase PlsY
MAGAYLAGSVNVSIILFSLLGKGDPRSHFSGNAGTVNVWRQAGLGWAAVVLLLDMLRGILLALLALHFLSTSLVPWVGFALILGNRYPCFHRFQGGKGVAAYLGFSFPLTSYAVVIACAAWAGLYVIAKIPFISSFALVTILATATILLAHDNLIAIAGVMATLLFIYWNHRSNIRQFLKKK